MQDLRIYFSDFFNVSRQTMKSYGVFDVSLINDLPMFIDPFLLFNSEKPEYQALHAEMIKYLKFLRDKSVGSELDKGRMYAWYVFKEIKQNWLGFSLSGNRGRGLGPDFASALHKNFNAVTVIIYYNETELAKVKFILRHVGLENDKSMILIDARNDNKESASKVKTPKLN